jgi:hypothetical protein
MRADLKRIKLLFKANNSSGQEGDERHSTEVNGRMHSGEAKNANLVGKHIQTKDKTRMGGGG